MALSLGPSVKMGTAVRPDVNVERTLIMCVCVRAAAACVILCDALRKMLNLSCYCMCDCEICMHCDRVPYIRMSVSAVSTIVYLYASGCDAREGGCERGVRSAEAYGTALA